LVETHSSRRGIDHIANRLRHGCRGNHKRIGLAADKAPEEAMDFANSVAPATAFEIQSSQLAQKNAKSAGDFKVAPKESMGVKHLANYELERAPQH
jgi:hypothetical protein